MSTSGVTARARTVALVVTATIAVAMVGASPAAASKPSFGKTVTDTLQIAHTRAGGVAMKTDSCLTRLARRTASKATKSHRTPSRQVLQRKANRSCKLTNASARVTKSKSARRAAKSLRKGLRHRLANPAVNRLGVATKRAHGRRVTIALVATRTLSTSAPAAPVVNAEFIARARAEFVRLVNVERANGGLEPVRDSACLDGVAQSWSEHIAAAHTMDHNVGTEGQAGYASCAPLPVSQLKYSAFNEIIAQVTQRQAGTPEGLAAAAVASFNASSPHRARMLTSSVTELGTGIAFDSAVGYWKLVGDLADYSPR